jgi:Icc-related predicted phosphoesterase
MKVKVLSDIHLEFGDFDPGNGDVLVLAGDICTASCFLFRSDAEYAARYIRFFERCVLNYNKVFYVMGNHEHYNGIFEDTETVLRENLPDGITILQNQSEFYNGWHFVGATLWTNFKEGNKEVMERCGQMLNEYSYVWHKGVEKHITPADTLAENRNTVEWLKQCLPTLRGNVMVISHHPPSFKSIEADYVTKDTVAAYASDQEALMEHDNVKVWAHGHVHGSQSYRLNDTHVVCNPRGYHPDGLNPKFDADRQLNLIDYETTL